MKKGLNQTEIFSAGVLIVVALLFMVPTIQKQGVLDNADNILAMGYYADIVDISMATKCGYMPEKGVGLANAPANAVLNRQNSYVSVSGHGRYGGDRIFTQFVAGTMRVNNQDFSNVFAAGFDGRLTPGDNSCQVSFHLDFTSQSAPITSTTMMLDRPPPARLDVFGILFKLIEDIGRWVKTLFGFSTYAFQKQVVVDAGTTYQKTFTFNTQSISKSSCYDPVVYQSGTCNYLNKCYMIMPKGCADLSCAAKKDCMDITATAQPTEILAVSYTPTQLNSEYAVVAFIAESDMTYVASSKTWSENTFIVESTKQSDVITVPGASVPPAAKGIVELFTQFMLDLINFIKGLFGI